MVVLGCFGANGCSGKTGNNGRSRRYSGQASPAMKRTFPMNDTFDTFAEQASCFLNLETRITVLPLSPVGIRLGDRLTGKPVHVDISVMNRSKRAFVRTGINLF